MKLNSRYPIRLAYIYKGYQPTLCTYISDEPYFYSTETKEESFDDFLDVIMSETPTSVWPRSSGVSYGSDKETTYTTLPNIYDSTQLDLVSLLDDISSVGYISSLLHRYAFTTNEFVKQVEVANGEVQINPKLSKEDALVAIIHAVKQHEHRTSYELNQLMPDDLVKHRIVETIDTWYSILRACWELKLLGKTSYWAEHYQLHSELFSGYELCVKRDFRYLKNKEGINLLCQQMLLLERGYIERSLKTLVAELLRESYMSVSDKKGEAFTKSFSKTLKQLDSNSIIDGLLTVLYNPKNNFEEYITTINRTTQNFIWFIKFELSFREYETTESETTVNV